MISTSTGFKTAIRSSSRRIKAKLIFPDKTIEEVDLIEIDSYLTDEEDFIIGTANMDVAKIEISDDPLNPILYDFNGKEAEIRLGVTLSDSSVEYYSIGRYTVEKSDRKSSKIYLDLVDRMHKSDIDYISNLSYPATLSQILASAAAQTGLVLDSTTFLNSDHIVNEKPVYEGITCRQVFAYIAELAGGYARIDRSGQLTILSLSSLPSVSITGDHYIDWKKAESSPGTIDKLIIKNGEESASSGTGDNIFTIVDNIFVSNPGSIVDNIFSSISTVNYKPGELNWIGDFSLDVGDRVTVDGEDTYILNRKLKYTGGLRETVKIPGKSNIEKNSTGKPNTNLEIRDIKTKIKIISGEIEQVITDTVSKTEWQQTVDGFNQTVTSIEEDIQNIELTPGPQGPAGSQGISITKIDVWYYLSTSSTSLAGGTWSTTAPAWVSGKYMWSKAITTYSTGATTESTAACITGAQGPTGTTGSTGATGTGVTSITEEFYLSTSKTTQTGGSWVTSPPVWSIDKYLWTRSKLIYNNPTSTAYTTPVVSSEWEAVNGLIPRFEANETSIATNSTNIALRALKTEVEGPIYKQITAPAHVNGRLWLNTSVTPNQLKRSTGTAWVNVTPTSGAEIGLSDVQITAKVESNSNVLATKAEVTLVDEALTARFSQIGGANMVRDSKRIVFSGFAGSDPVITYNYNGEEGKTRVKSVVGDNTSVLKAYSSLGIFGIEEHNEVPLTLSCYVKNNRELGGPVLTVDSHRYGSTTVNPQETKRIALSGSNSSTRGIQLQFESPTPGWLVDVIVWDIQVEKGWVATEWTPHPDELYTGITRIDNTGINVAVSSSEINTQITYDGLNVRDGENTLANFGASGAVIPIAEIGEIRNDKVVQVVASGSYTVGSGGNFSNMAVAMDALFKDGNLLLRGQSVSFTLTSNLSERILVAGIHGGEILINLNGKTLSGSVKVAFSTSRVLVYGGTIKSRGATALLAEASPAVELLSTNIDGGGVQYPVYADKGAVLMVRDCDFVNCRWGPHSTANSTIHSYDNRGNVDYSYRASWAGKIFVFGTVPRGALATENVIRGWAITSSVTPADSTYQIPPVTNETFTQVFSSATFDTLIHGTSNVDSYFGPTAAQNRWDASMGWKNGRVRMNSAIFDFFNGGSNTSVQYRLRRRNSTHGSSLAVKPTPYNHAASFATGALRGGWTSWASITSSHFTSGGATLTFYNGVAGSAGYAIWDAIEVQVTVTKQI